jgi:hypothetical protein
LDRRRTRDCQRPPAEAYVPVTRQTRNTSGIRSGLNTTMAPFAPLNVRRSSQQ